MSDGPRYFARPPLEKYVRATVAVVDYTVEPAIEFRETDSFDLIVAALDDVARTYFRETNPMKVAASIGAALAARWPGRAYFVEVWQEGRTGFAQIFQPYGVPVNI